MLQGKSSYPLRLKNFNTKRIFNRDIRMEFGYYQCAIREKLNDKSRNYLTPHQECLLMPNRENKYKFVRMPKTDLIQRNKLKSLVNKISDKRGE